MSTINYARKEFELTEKKAEGGMPSNHEITHCTQCGKKFTPVRRPLTTWNSNFFGGFDVLCKQCVTRNERAAAVAVNQAERFFNKS